MGVTLPRPTSISGSDFYEDVSETAPTLPPPSPLGLDLHEAHWEACVLALACIALLLGLLGHSIILYDY